MPTSMALLLFMIQKAPPMIRIKTIISALSSKPSNNAEKSAMFAEYFTYLNESLMMTSRVPSPILTLLRSNWPPGMNHVKPQLKLLSQKQLRKYEGFCPFSLSVTLKKSYFMTKVKIYKELLQTKELKKGD